MTYPCSPPTHEEAVIPEEIITTNYQTNLNNLMQEIYSVASHLSAET